jgi:hypothetical protein
LQHCFQQLFEEKNMKRFLIFLVLFSLIGMASADWYPQKINAGSLLQTDTGANNGEALISVQTIGNATLGPMVITANQIKTTTAINNVTASSITTFTHQPDYARVLTVTANASTSGYWKFTGTDMNGAAITSYINLSSASSGTGLKAFKTIASLICKLDTGQTPKTFTVGVGGALGLNTKLTTNTLLLASLDGTKDTIAASTQSATVLSLNTVTLTTALAYNKPVKVWYMVTA